MKNINYFSIGGVPEHFNVPWKKAIDEGVFSLKNIELDWHDYRGGTGDLIKSLANKELDIAIMLTEGAVKSVADGNPFKIVQIYVNSPLVWGVYAFHNTTLGALQSLKEAPRFCISRYNSGSHLMAYLLAEKYDWQLTNNHFVIVDHFLGALKTMQENPNYLFMWERFMTKPYVDSQQFVKLDEIATPWPSFSIVVRQDFYKEHQEIIELMIALIQNYCYKFKQNTIDSIEYLASYFNFSIHDMKNWINETDWNYFYDHPSQKLKPAFDFLVKHKIIPNINYDDVFFDK
jgi:hypothetical protein